MPANKDKYYKLDANKWLNNRCSYFAKGVYIDLLCIMHESKTGGYLVVNEKPLSVDDIAKMLHLDADIAIKTLEELMSFGLISQNKQTGVIYSETEVKRAEYSSKQKSIGQKGGNPLLHKISKRVNPLSEKNLKRDNPFEENQQISINSLYKQKLKRDNPFNKKQEKGLTLSQDSELKRDNPLSKKNPKRDNPFEKGLTLFDNIDSQKNSVATSDEVNKNNDSVVKGVMLLNTENNTLVNQNSSNSHTPQPTSPINTCSQDISNNKLYSNSYSYTTTKKIKNKKASSSSTTKNLKIFKEKSSRASFTTKSDLEFNNSDNSENNIKHISDIIPKTIKNIPDELAPPDILKIFDDVFTEVWGGEIKEKHRSFPKSTDHSYAQKYIELGVTIQNCRDIFLEKQNNRKSAGQKPIDSLAYFRDAIPEFLQKLEDLQNGIMATKRSKKSEKKLDKLLNIIDQQNKNNHASNTDNSHEESSKPEASNNKFNTRKTRSYNALGQG